MNRIGALVLAAAFSSVTLLGSAWGEDVEEQLKKLETDRAAAAVKGDVDSKSKRPPILRSSTCTAKCRTSRK